MQSSCTRLPRDIIKMETKNLSAFPSHTCVCSVVKVHEPIGTHHHFQGMISVKMYTYASQIFLLNMQYWLHYAQYADVLLCFLGRHINKDVAHSSWNILYTQQKSYSISHQLGTVTRLWLDSDVVTVDNWRQHGDRAANGSVVTVLPADANSHCPVTVKWLPSRWLMK